MRIFNTRNKQLTTVAIAAVVMTYYEAACRVGVGKCPTQYDYMHNAFGPNGQIANGLYNLVRIDSQLQDDWDTYMKKSGEATLNCQIGLITKTDFGFTWSQPVYPL